MEERLEKLKDLVEARYPAENMSDAQTRIELVSMIEAVDEVGVEEPLHFLYDMLFVIHADLMWFRQAVEDLRMDEIHDREGWIDDEGVEHGVHGNAVE